LTLWLALLDTANGGHALARRHGRSGSAPGVRGRRDSADRAVVPQVSLVIPTRNRADRVVTAVRAILASDTDSFEIIVVDQSEDDATRVALVQLRAVDMLRYVKAAGRGSAAARNVGIGEASAEIIGLTDDDCEVSADWIRKLTAAFEADGRIGAVFGNVIPAAHDDAAGFIPGPRARSPRPPSAATPRPVRPPGEPTRSRTRHRAPRSCWCDQGRTCARLIFDPSLDCIQSRIRARRIHSTTDDRADAIIRPWSPSRARPGLRDHGYAPSRQVHERGHRVRARKAIWTTAPTQGG
jgi:glycosyltransferase involved in cell wall biosynthesis